MSGHGEGSTQLVLLASYELTTELAVTDGALISMAEGDFMTYTGASESARESRARLAL